MGKIYSSSKHSHQDRMVPYMGKGPEMSYKIQKRHNTLQDAASVHTEENSSEIDIPTEPVIGTPPQNLYTPHIHCSCDPCTDSEGEVTYKTNFLDKYCKYCNRCGETHCWCFTSNWEDRLHANNPNSSVEILPSPTARKPPSGWPQNRCRVIKKTDTTGSPSPREDISTDSGTGMH